MSSLIPKNHNRLLELERQLLHRKKAAQQQNPNPNSPQQSEDRSLNLPQHSDNFSYSKLAFKLQQPRPVFKALPSSSLQKLPHLQESDRVDFPPLLEPFDLGFENSETTIPTFDRSNETPKSKEPIRQFPLANNPINSTTNLPPDDNQNLSYSQLAQQLQSARLSKQIPQPLPESKTPDNTNRIPSEESPEATEIISITPIEITLVESDPENTPSIPE